MPEGAPLILNYDDPFLRKAELPDHVRPVWFSMASQEADVYASAIRQEDDGMSFLLDDAENGCFMVHIGALGRHNVTNALAAYCAAIQAGLEPRDALRQMKEFRQTGMRQQILDSHGIKIIKDCYKRQPQQHEGCAGDVPGISLQAAVCGAGRHAGAGGPGPGRP